MNNGFKKGIVMLVGVLIWGCLFGSNTKAYEAKADIKTAEEKLMVNMSREDGISIVPSEKTVINTNIGINFRVNTDVDMEVFEYKLSDNDDSKQSDFYIDRLVDCQYSISEDGGKNYGEWLDMNDGQLIFSKDLYHDGLYYIKFRKLERYVLNEERIASVKSIEDSKMDSEHGESDENKDKEDIEDKLVEKNAKPDINGVEEAEIESSESLSDNKINSESDNESVDEIKEEAIAKEEANTKEDTNTKEYTSAKEDANTENDFEIDNDLKSEDISIEKANSELLEYEIAQGVVKHEPVHELVSAEYAIRVDTKEPDAEIFFNRNINEWCNENIFCYLKLNDADSRLSTVRVTCDDTNVMEYTYNDNDIMTGGMKRFVISNESKSSDGSNLRVEVSDKAGNVKVIERQLFIDKKKPEIEVSGVDNGNVYDSITNLKISGKDDLPQLVTVEYSIKRKYNDQWQMINEGKKSLIEINGSSVYCFAQDGDYEIRVRAIDKANNCSGDTVSRFRVDMTAPKINYAGVDDGETLCTDAGVTISASDNFINDYKVTLTGSYENNGIKKNLSMADFAINGLNSFNTYYFNNDGNYDITAKVEDSAGNSSEKQVSFSIDTTPPVISVSKGIVAGSSMVLSEAPTIGFKITENNYETASVKCELKKKGKLGGYEKCDTPEWELSGKTTELDLAVEEEGAYELVVSCEDEAGNISEKKISFTVDTSSPEIDYIDGLDKKYVKSFKLPDNFSEYIKDTTAVSYQTYINSKNYDGSEEIKEDGKYILKVSAVDDAGNQSDKTVEFIVDSTLPRLVVEGMDDKGNVNRNEKVILSLYDADDYFTSVKIDGVEQLTGDRQQVVELTIPEYGDYKIEIEASDMAENIMTQTIEARCSNASPIKSDTTTIKNLRKAENSGNNKALRIVMIVLTVIILVVTIVGMSIYFIGNSEE